MVRLFTEVVRQLTEYAYHQRVATDNHINETSMLEQDDHFEHLYDNQPIFGQKIGAPSMHWLGVSSRRTGPATRWSIPFNGYKRSKRLFACLPDLIWASTVGTAMERMGAAATRNG